MNRKLYTMAQAGKIVAGAGTLATIAEQVGAYGAKKVLIVTDPGVCSAGLVEQPQRLLAAAGIESTVIFSIPPEPAIGHVEAALTEARGWGCDMVVGLGGGSAMDAAKLIAVLLTTSLSLRDLVAQASGWRRQLPLLLVPTTAGTGSEATPNAIVLDPEAGVKIGIVNPELVPDCILLDPLLTLGLPPAITAATGMDALSHAIECYISQKANPLSDTFALKAVSLISRSLRTAFLNGADVDARHDMLLAAMFGGMCIASSSTTAVHALSYPLGGRYRIPHGLANAILLPYVMEFNLTASEPRFAELAAAMHLPVAGLSTAQAAAAMLENLYSLIRDLQIEPSLKPYGITEKEVDSLATAAAGVTRLLNNNPRPMSHADIRSVYLRLL
ncbi:MAG: iron-containing alcohol dehydrogenase [Sporomusaceae bacterium]|nr:iron-containing alcohol dehydrogenase [Sporomusaceae bacterium]